MPWTSATITKNTELPDIVGISVQYTDATDFVAPFTFAAPRVDMSAGQVSNFKVLANAALDAERTRRRAVTSRETQLLTLMNS